MRNLGHYIIPQIFTNPRIEIYPRNNIQNVNMSEFKKDFKDDFEILFKTIEFKNEQWVVRVVKEVGNREDYRDLVWDKNGKFLGLLE